MPGIYGGADESAQSAEESARRANEQYQQQADAGIDFNKEQGGINRADLEKYYGEGQGYLDPYYQGGKSALTDYLASLGIGGEGVQKGMYERFQQTPGYQFGLQQGLDAISKSAAARGLAQSGAAIKAATQYGQDYASQRYGEFQDRLANMAGMGANVANQMAGNALNTGSGLAQNGQQMAGNISNFYRGKAESAADSELAAGAARQSAYQNQRNNLGSLIGSAATGAGYLFGGPAGGAAGAAVGSLFK